MAYQARTVMSCQRKIARTNITQKRKIKWYNHMSQPLPLIFFHIWQNYTNQLTILKVIYIYLFIMVIMLDSLVHDIRL